MKTHLKTWINIKPWLIGVLLSTVAMFLGYDLGSEAAGLLGGEPGIWARLAKGFVWGGVIAGLQWSIVRVVGVRPIRFIVASAFGFAVGYPLGQTIPGHLRAALYGILVGSCYIRVVSGCATMVDIPSAHKTRKPVGLVQRDRMDSDRRGLD